MLSETFNNVQDNFKKIKQVISVSAFYFYTWFQYLKYRKISYIG